MSFIELPKIEEWILTVVHLCCIIEPLEKKYLRLE